MVTRCVCLFVCVSVGCDVSLCLFFLCSFPGLNPFRDKKSFLILSILKLRRERHRYLVVLLFAYSCMCSVSYLVVFSKMQVLKIFPSQLLALVCLCMLLPPPPHL
jgi:hypothetical protein